MTNKTCTILKEKVTEKNVYKYIYAFNARLHIYYELKGYRALAKADLDSDQSVFLGSRS